MYDTIVFSLTFYRTWPSIRRKEAGFILQRLFEDGLLYYSVIFSVTLVLTIMIIAAPPGLKNITAQLEQLITVAMMSRITLNLRKAGRHAETEILAGGPKCLFFQRRQWWDDDIFVQTEVATHVSTSVPPQPPQPARGRATASNGRESPTSMYSDMPETPPDAVIKGTNLRFANPSSHESSDLFPRGHEEYELDRLPQRTKHSTRL
ncbi:hypothetical protein ONZ45_g15902 [Pleurotus djamor]|nr:hypothetical protein ONZ45_g15902 [Pleurotus djamor]